MIKVSIIIPVYNTAPYLHKCLDSVMNQTIKEIEVILINDGSIDGSGEILKEYSEKFPDKIKLISKINEGQGKARNIGIEMAEGEYLGFVDSDDYIELSMYEELYKEAKERDLDLVECLYNYIHENGKPLKPYGFIRNYKNRQDMFVGTLVSPWNKLIKRTAIVGNDIRFPEKVIYEDTSFFIKAIPYLEKWGFIDRAFVTHILRGTSTMNINKSKRIRDIIPVVEDYIEFYKQNNNYDDFKIELEYFTTKILLNSSLRRISKIPDKELRHRIFEETYNCLITNFPEYKKNKMIKSSLQDLYMKTFQKRFERVYLFLFSLV